MSRENLNTKMRKNLHFGIVALICVGFLSGCALLESTAKLGDRIQVVDGEIQKLTRELDSTQDPEMRAHLASQIDLLRKERESLTVKIKVAEKAKEGVGSGIESVLGILGILLGVPLLGSAGGVAKSLITRGKG